MNVGDKYELRFRGVTRRYDVFDAEVTVAGFCDAHERECVMVERADGARAWVYPEELFEIPNGEVA